MPTLSSLNSLPPPHLLPSSSAPPRRFLFFRRPHHHLQSRLRLRLVASAASSHEYNPNGKCPSSGSKKSVLSNLMHEIEPLDVSHIQKDVPADTVDAMKRTISGMLGLLPSEQFNVLIEALWEPLSKLLISSMMTGYTLRNAEYRLCLERNLELHDRHSEKQKPEYSNHDGPEVLFDGNTKIFSFTGEKELSPESERTEDLSSDIVDVQGLGEISPEAEEYIHHLYARLSSAKNELREIERKNAALQMQHFVGEEKNDLLDYLRSLQPEKVAELSEPTSPELQEIVQSVVHGLLATLSPKMHSKLPTQSENPKSGTLNIGKDDCTELLENTSLHFQPLISLTRDYLARLLFWCMLLGHYLRGLEYRLQLMQLLTLSGEDRSGTRGSKQSA